MVDFFMHGHNLYLELHHTFPVTVRVTAVLLVGQGGGATAFYAVHFIWLEGGVQSP